MFNIQIDSNIFYSFGRSSMDLSISQTADGLIGNLFLNKKFPFFRQFYSQVFIHVNGCISLGSASTATASSSPLIQAFQTGISLKNGGDVFYREVLNEETIFEKIKKDINSQGDLAFEPSSAFIVTCNTNCVWPFY